MTRNIEVDVLDKEYESDEDVHEEEQHFEDEFLICKLCK
jgi:hypothetical protein